MPGRMYEEEKILRMLARSEDKLVSKRAIRNLRRLAERLDHRIGYRTCALEEALRMKEEEANG